MSDPDHLHEWELAYRDGPTDMSDWKCKCGDYVQKRGNEPPPIRDERK